MNLMSHRCWAGVPGTRRSPAQGDQIKIIKHACNAAPGRANNAYAYLQVGRPVICLTCRPLSPPPIMAVGMAAKTATRRRRSVVRGGIFQCLILRVGVLMLSAVRYYDRVYLYIALFELNKVAQLISYLW